MFNNDNNNAYNKFTQRIHEFTGKSILDTFSQELKESLERELPRDWDKYDCKEHLSSTLTQPNFNKGQKLLYNNGSDYINGISYF